KLLDDPVRAVRIQAASVLSAVPDQGLAQDRVPAFRTAYDELLKYLHYQADLSTGALMLADHYTRVGELEQAEHHYRRTLKMDRQANYARLQLARLYNAQGRNPEALAVLDEASMVDPENARIPYDKALLYAELDRMDDALNAFTEADRLKLESDRLYVNLSALHQ
ncbi:MAG: tetratricopeptide repeat protein, partial [Flavobacteriales bacterium]|nr:tetratricopeptide repeat protein [Flavobacteriales bacterium]